LYVYNALVKKNGVKKHEVIKKGATPTTTEVELQKSATDDLKTTQKIRMVLFPKQYLSKIVKRKEAKRKSSGSPSILET
jgi:hypothetical protein